MTGNRPFQPPPSPPPPHFKLKSKLAKIFMKGGRYKSINMNSWIQNCAYMQKADGRASRGKDSSC